MLDREQQRLRLLHALTSSVRSPAANLRAAAENLASYPDMEVERRARFIEIVAAESALLSRSIDEALRGYADAVKASLTLSDMRAASSAARRRLEALPGLAVESDSVSDELWLRIDSFAIIQAFTFLSDKLRAEYGVRRVHFAARARESFIELDLGWEGAIVASEALSLWETQPLGEGPLTCAMFSSATEPRSGFMRRDLAGSSGRVPLPPAGGRAGSRAEAPARAAESRPEYTTSTFRYGDSARELDERRLSDLSYTVFDTETTGLEPSAGDEIIGIGAVRIVNARLLKNEVFERLVNPRRPLNRESARIHGIDARRSPPSRALRRCCRRSSFLRGHGPGRAQCGFRHALSRAQGGLHRRALCAAGARHAAARRCCTPASTTTAWRRWPTGWGCR